MKTSSAIFKMKPRITATAVKEIDQYAGWAAGVFADARQQLHRSARYVLSGTVPRYNKRYFWRDDWGNA